MSVVGEALVRHRAERGQIDSFGVQAADDTARLNDQLHRVLLPGTAEDVATRPIHEQTVQD